MFSSDFSFEETTAAKYFSDTISHLAGDGHVWIINFRTGVTLLEYRTSVINYFQGSGIDFRVHLTFFAQFKSFYCWCCFRAVLNLIY